jgi:preprotein translocase subunit SecY
VLLMWFGEQITKRGIGNGISLLIFASIIDRAPLAIRRGSTAARRRSSSSRCSRSA